jgi:predicted nucleic acid-binding protein
MNVYVDSSVLLRVVLNERGALREWLRLECRRTIDRARVREQLDDHAVARHREAILDLLDAFDVVPLGTVVLERAAEPFPTLLGSLDAIHLATAVLAREQVDDLYFATHDGELAIAARAVGFKVLGVSPSRARRGRSR